MISTTSSTSSPTILISTSRQTPSNSSSIQYLSPLTGSSTHPSPSISTPIQHLTLLPSSSSSHILATSQHDTSLLLFSHKKIHWKCYLPESLQSLLFVKDSILLFGGGKSGTLYVWDTTTNTNTGGGGSNSNNNSSSSSLLKRFQAHHRSITSLTHCTTSNVLLSGGEDGIVHSWNIWNLLQTGNNSTNNTVHPYQSWSEHHLPITDLKALSGERAVSVSLDCQVVIMDLLNGNVLARVVMPSGIMCVEVDDVVGRIYSGATNGTIYILDISAYAMSTTLQNAKPTTHLPTTTSQQRQQRPITELRNHERGITSLALLSSSNMLVSGGQEGSIRVWDLRTRSCTKIIRPWQQQQQQSQTVAAMMFPISSIVVLEQQRRFNENDLNWIGPLEKYPNEERGGGGDTVVCRKRKWILRDDDDDDDNNNNNNRKEDQWKRQRLMTSCCYCSRRRRRNLDSSHQTVMNENTTLEVKQDDELTQRQENEIRTLRRELEEANHTIERWQTVNNKLVIKLKKKQMDDG